LAPLGLSQRSNGLAFSQHHYLSSTPGGSSSSSRPVKKQHATSLSLISASVFGSSAVSTKTSDDKGALRTVDKNARAIAIPVAPASKLSLQVERNPSQANRNVQKAPMWTIPAKPNNRLSGAPSIRSFSSSVISRKRKFAPAASTLTSLPSEILDQTFSYLIDDQETLHSLMLTNTYLVEAAAIAMYDRPKFASTYRFAQFVSTIIHQRGYAHMVRWLDLSSFGKEEDEEIPSAGWREWKYRSEPLYSIARENTIRGERVNYSSLREQPDEKAVVRTSHPRPNQFLKKWHLCRDVPIGAVIHVLEACKRIKYDCLFLCYRRVTCADTHPGWSTFPSSP
jgi:hypothetical protein